MKYIIANWKANKNKKEVKIWLESFISKNPLPTQPKLEIIIAAPYVFLPLIQPTLIHLDHLYLAAQDVSSFPNGSHTGQITSRMLSEFVDYVLIGHSETRKFFPQTPKDIQNKINLCVQYSLIPIIFIASPDQPPQTYPDNSFFVFEPPAAISQPGKSHPFPLKKTLESIKILKSKIKSPKAKFLYGGSINEKNIADYLSCPQIDGVVPGRASLDVKTFVKLTENALKSL